MPTKKWFYYHRSQRRCISHAYIFNAANYRKLCEVLIGSKSASTEAPRVVAGRSSIAPPGLSKVILFAVSFLIIVISFYQVIGKPHAHDNWTIAVSFTCLTWLGVYFSCTYLQFRSFYLFTSAYVLPLCAFHLGVIVPDAIGWFDAGWMGQRAVSALAGTGRLVYSYRSGWYRRRICSIIKSIPFSCGSNSRLPVMWHRKAFASHFGPGPA